MRTLRNVFRRRLRAFLTIFGITIGVLALVVMGALATKLQKLVAGGTEYYQDKVMISAAGGISGFSSAPMSRDIVQRLERIDGVLRASGSVGLLLDEEPSSVNFGIPPSISGNDRRSIGFEKFEVDYAQGRELKPGERGKVVVGSDLVNQLDAEVGKEVTIRGKQFEVVGILERTLTAPDKAVEMNLADAQDIYVATLPSAVRETIHPGGILTGVAAYAEEGVDPDTLADKIQDELGDEFDAMGPAGFKKSVQEPLEIFNQIIYAVALISLVVGGLSVINTMTMSVAERTREIGIRKAIGATDGAVMRQFVAESAVIGLIGGLVGLGLGWVITILGNAAGVESSNELFLVTPALAVGSVAFAVFLGVMSGLYPAWHAARLNPVQALRYE